MQHELYDRPISKRALELEQVTDKIKEIWRVYEGPFANIFRILSYAIPFVPGLGWGMFALEKLAAFFGWGMGDLGGALDKTLGLMPGSEIPGPQQISLGIQNLVQEATASNENEEIIKNAGIISSVFNFVGGPIRIANLLWKTIKFLLLAFGITKLGDIYTMTTGMKKMPGEILMEEDKTEEGLGSADIKGIMSLVADPSKLINPFSNGDKI